MIAASARSYEANDFFCLWNGARFALLGRDPYDLVQWREATGGLHLDFAGVPRPSSCEDRFAYPYWTALVLAPFGALPLTTAAAGWAAAAVATTSLGAAFAWRAADAAYRTFALFAVIVVFSQPFWLLLVGGQITGPLLLAVGAFAFAVKGGRQIWAGLALSALVVKPQLGAGLIPLSVLHAGLQRRWLLVAAAALGALSLSVASIVRAPGWPGAWLIDVLEFRSSFQRGLATAWGIGLELGGPAWGVPLVVAAVAAFAVVVRAVRPSPVEYGALAVALSLFVAPHAWSYDHLLLVLPWATTMALAERIAGRLRLAVLGGVVVVASLLPWALYALAFLRGRETLSAFVPAATFLLLAVALGLARAEPGRQTPRWDAKRPP